MPAQLALLVMMRPMLWNVYMMILFWSYCNWCMLLGGGCNVDTVHTCSMLTAMSLKQLSIVVAAFANESDTSMGFTQSTPFCMLLALLLVARVQCCTHEHTRVCYMFEIACIKWLSLVVLNCCWHPMGSFTLLCLILGWNCSCRPF